MENEVAWKMWRQYGEGVGVSKRLIRIERYQGPSRCKTHLHQVETGNVERLGGRNVETLGLQRYINKRNVKRWKGGNVRQKGDGWRGGEVERWRGGEVFPKWGKTAKKTDERQFQLAN